MGRIRIKNSGRLRRRGVNRFNIATLQVLPIFDKTTLQPTQADAFYFHLHRNHCKLPNIFLPKIQQCSVNKTDRNYMG